MPKLFWFAPPGVCWVTRFGAGVEIAEKRAKVKVHLLNQPSAMIGRRRDTVHLVTNVSTKRVTPIKAEVQEVVHTKLTGMARAALRGAAGEERSVQSAQIKDDEFFSSGACVAGTVFLSVVTRVMCVMCAERLIRANIVRLKTAYSRMWPQMLAGC
jgi:hypothetical protein